MNLNISIIGAGSFGTALALLFYERGHGVRIWGHDPEKVKEINRRRENVFYLPGFPLPEGLEVSNSLEEVVSSGDVLVFVTPSQTLREIAAASKEFIKRKALIIVGSKGIEVSTLKTLDEVLRDVLGEEICDRVGFFSGPTFAREIAAKMPTAGVLASGNEETARRLQQLMSHTYFRVYSSDDVKGVILGGAIKNVIAIAAGIGDGMGLGYNSRAALITRGLAEITRLGVRLGANPLTFQGLAGVGDLVLTCTGSLSRNRTVGMRLGKGESIDEIVASMKMVAEGVKTSRAAYKLSRKLGVEMPITEAVYQVIYENVEPSEAVKSLMTRALKPEIYGY